VELNYSGVLVVPAETRHVYFSKKIFPSKKGIRKGPVKNGTAATKEKSLLSNKLTMSDFKKINESVDTLVYDNLTTGAERSEWKRKKLIELGAYKPKTYQPYKIIKEESRQKKIKIKESMEQERVQLGILGSKAFQAATKKPETTDEIKEYVNQLKGNRTGITLLKGDNLNGTSVGQMKGATLVVSQEHIQNFEHRGKEKKRPNRSVSSTLNLGMEKKKKSPWSQKSKGKKKFKKLKGKRRK